MSNRRLIESIMREGQFNPMAVDCPLRKGQFWVAYRKWRVEFITLSAWKISATLKRFDRDRELEYSITIKEFETPWGKPFYERLRQLTDIADMAIYNHETGQDYV